MYPRIHRLTKKQDFSAIFKRGVRRYTSSVQVHSLPNRQDIFRIAVVVPNSVHKKAVKRNVIRRRLREIIRKHFDLLHPGNDYIFFAKKPSLGKKYSELEIEVLSLFQNKRR